MLVERRPAAAAGVALLGARRRAFLLWQVSGNCSSVVQARQAPRLRPPRVCRLGRASCPGVPCNVFSGVQTYSWYAQRDSLRPFKPCLTPFCCAGLHGLAAACSAPIVDRDRIGACSWCVGVSGSPRAGQRPSLGVHGAPRAAPAAFTSDRGSFKTSVIADRHTGALHGFASVPSAACRLNWAARQVVSSGSSIPQHPDIGKGSAPTR